MTNHDHEHDCHGHHHHHSKAEEFVESALRKSARHVVRFDAPKSAKDVAARTLSVLSEIAGHVAYEDVILGHIKALIDFGDQKVNISITRLDECSQNFDYLGSLEVTGCVLTVNILSLHNTEVEIDDLIEKLFAV